MSHLEAYDDIFILIVYTCIHLHIQNQQQYYPLSLLHIFIYCKLCYACILLAVIGTYGRDNIL